MNAAGPRSWSLGEPPSQLACQWLGRLPYPAALERMTALAAERRRGERDDTVLFLEHPPVLTIGRGCGREEVLAQPEELARLGVTVHETDRGGRVTYHGPGQLVGYPILWIGRSPTLAARYARALGDAMVGLCARLGLQARWDESRPGVWVGEAKIGAVGVRVEQGVSRHGFALNVSTDLSHYRLIVPCGLRDAGLASVRSLLGEAPPLEEVALLASRALADVLPPQERAQERAATR